MRYISGDTADDVWRQALKELLERPDYKPDGRNGFTREVLPCGLTIKDPRQRWILSRYPPYNPAFGLVEFIWLITGKNESHVLNYWNPSLPKFAGTGETYHGAYGFRLRNEFCFDQIERAFNALSNNPQSRQIVLQIWNSKKDLPNEFGEPRSLDIPCNIISFLKLRDGHLHWSQIMRSNDIMLGLPYNIIQFTMIHEIMAGWLNAKLGNYFHMSDSLHVYDKDLSIYKCSNLESIIFDRKNFDMTYSESNELFNQIYHNLEEVSFGNKKDVELEDIFYKNSQRNAGQCDLIKDILAIIGSDAARRQNYIDLSYHFIDSCVDPNLQKAALLWLEYRRKYLEQ